MAEPAVGRTIRFTKMHGAGNDFVVLDLRDGAADPSPDLCRALADRHVGVGCDQILTLHPPRSAGAVAAYGIWNADGSQARQCGNGARCVAAWLLRDGGLGDAFDLDSPAGTHRAERLDDALLSIVMGVPAFEPSRIPLAGVHGDGDEYTLTLDGVGELRFGAVSMGNPHAVVEVESLDDAPVERIGRALQGSAAFPESVNVGFAQVMADDRVRLRVYERGVGETRACGSGACAAAAILTRRGRIGRDVAISLPGGTLRIAWPADDAPMVMAGPAAFVFEGEWIA